MERYIIFGCGGMALEVIEYLLDRKRDLQADGQDLEISDIIDASVGRLDDAVAMLGYVPEMHVDPTSVQDRSEKRLLICIGDARVRDAKFRDLKAAGFEFATLIHGSAVVATSARVEEGSIICPFAFISAKSHVAANCIVNVRGTIGHDARLGRSSVVSPHVDMNGASACGAVSFLGAGVIMDPGTSIGAYTKVASGSVVKQEFGDGFLLVGNPAKGRRFFEVPTQES